MGPLWMIGMGYKNKIAPLLFQNSPLLINSADVE